MERQLGPEQNIDGSRRRPEVSTRSALVRALVRGLLCAVVAGLSAASSFGAGEAVLRKGAWLRVSLGARTVIGTPRSLDDKTLVLTTQKDDVPVPVPTPLETIRRIEVRSSSRARSAGRGALTAGVGLRLMLQGQAAPLAGRLVSLDSDSIVLQPSGEKARRRVGWDSIEAVEVAHRRTLAGLGAGVAAGAAAGAIWSMASGDSVGEDALLVGLIGLPAAAVGVAVAGGEHPATTGALAGAAVDAALLGVVLGGWCAAWSQRDSGSCFARTALLGAAFGAISGGVAAQVSRRHWTPVWARRVAVGIGPTKGRGAALVVRLVF
jgi:hypothetical protein